MIGIIRRTPDSQNRFSIIQGRSVDTMVDLEAGEIRTTPLLLVYIADPSITRGESRVFHKSIDVGIPLFGVVLPETAIGAGGTEVMHGAGLRGVS